MFGIGSTELIVILLVALIVLGPKSLAGAARSLGKAVGEFRRVSTDFQRTLNMEAAQAEMREAEEKKRANAENAAKQADNSVEPSGKPEAAFNSSPDELISGLPPDSPVAQALAKAKSQASQLDDVKDA